MTPVIFNSDALYFADDPLAKTNHPKYRRYFSLLKSSNEVRLEDAILYSSGTPQSIELFTNNEVLGGLF